MTNEDSHKPTTTMQHTGILLRLRGKRICLAALILLAAAAPGYALRMTAMPKELCSTNKEPHMRVISLKLPLRQPEFHWTFMSRRELLAGKLVLRIIRTGQTNEIVIFEGGQLREGWEPISLQNPKAGEIYFGFKSARKYPTAPDDQLQLELRVTQDLQGIGPTETGVLPAGLYKARGTYAGLIDEYKTPEQLKNVPQATLAKLRQAYEFTAFLENWQEQWDLRITGEQGWLPASQRQRFQQMLERSGKENAAGEK